MFYFSKRTSVVLEIFLFTLITTSSVYAQQVRVWASSGDKKVLQSQLPLSQGNSVTSMAWDGSTAKLFGGRNEVVSSALHIEASQGDLTNLSVSVSPLRHSSGYTISSTPASGDQLFNYVGRNIELFYVRYLQVKGISQNISGMYDERHLPEIMRGIYDSMGVGHSDWYSRPGANKYFPDIAVPLELVPRFSVWNGSSQMIWMDVYVPKGAPAGTYTGSYSISQNGSVIRTVPISMEVFGFTLPDNHTSKTMLVYTPDNLDWRFFGKSYLNPASAEGQQSILVRDRYFMQAHRHGIDLISTNVDYTGDQPSPAEWPKRLSGELYTAANGYDGPGSSTPNSIFAIGLYGSWSWKNQGEAQMRIHTDAWETWFRLNAPRVERFLYLADEEDATYDQINQWASWVKNNPGPGSALRTFATKELPKALAQSPSLTMIGSTIFQADPAVWQPALNSAKASNKKVVMYNGHRPASGTFYLEDDATAPREVPWGQFKKGVDRWFVWEGTAYRNSSSLLQQTPLLTKAQTFGGEPIFSSLFGETGDPSSASGLYSNSDGVLMYPGKDVIYPDQSYGVNGPMASLRMKYWRRGIQDVDYLAMAKNFAPDKVNEIMNRVVPKALWEYGVNDPKDPSWVRTEISWSSNPDAWESARMELAVLLAQHAGEATPVVNVPTPSPTSTGSGQSSSQKSGSQQSSSQNSNASSQNSSAATDVVTLSGTTTTITNVSTTDVGNSFVEIAPRTFSKAKVTGKVQITNKDQKKLLQALAKRHFKNIKVKLVSAGYTSQTRINKNLTFTVSNVPLLNPLRAKIVLPKNLTVIRAKASITSIKASS